MQIKLRLIVGVYTYFTSLFISTLIRTLKKLLKVIYKHDYKSYCWSSPLSVDHQQFSKAYVFLFKAWFVLPSLYHYFHLPSTVNRGIIPFHPLHKKLSPLEGAQKTLPNYISTAPPLQTMLKHLQWGINHFISTYEPVEFFFSISV